MGYRKIILLSKDALLISECREVTDELNLEIDISFDFTGLLLEVQDIDYRIIILDCSQKSLKCLAWVRILRKMRPKVPLIVIMNDIDKELGARLYEENIYFMFPSPVNKVLLKEILNGAIMNCETKMQ